MMQTEDTHVIEKTEDTVIDFEVAAAAITTDRIAAALLHLAGNESVRVIEALASTIVNAIQSGCEARHPFVFGRTRLMHYPRAITAEETAKVAAFKRIARRAVSRTLSDPTRGATAFHRIETSPPWSPKLLPIAVFGSFLFYRV